MHSPIIEQDILRRSPPLAEVSGLPLQSGTAHVLGAWADGAGLQAEVEVSFWLPICACAYLLYMCITSYLYAHVQYMHAPIGEYMHIPIGEYMHIPTGECMRTSMYT